jgi:hypothetical protein
LLRIVHEELSDFVWVHDTEGKAGISERPRSIVCERCSEEYPRSDKLRCPHCGHPNIYQLAIDEIRETIGFLHADTDDPIGKRMLAGTERSRIEAAYSKAVSCFESFLRQQNAFLCELAGIPSKKLSRPNLFQNIQDSEAWFCQNHGVSILGAFPSGRDRVLTLTFDKRHVLIHNGGVMDRRYVEKTGSDLQIGQPIELDKQEITEALTTISSMVQTFRARFCGT